MDREEMVQAARRAVEQWAEEALGDDPDWRPLESAIPYEWCGGFMWMNRTTQGDAVIELYKHGITRRYLNLDHNRQAYRYSEDGYVKITLDTAVDHVFDGIEEMGWDRETKYDEEFIRTKHKALRDMGYTVISSAGVDPE